MSKDPAFLFYPNDYIGGTMGMSFEEKGAYIELLMLQFNRGHMTSHMIGQAVGQIWDNIQCKFKVDGEGLYYNPRLDEEVKKRQNFVDSRKNNISGVNQYTKSKGHKSSHMDGHMTSHMEDEDVNRNIVISTGIGGTKDAREELSKVITLYMDRININPSPSCIESLKFYTENMGAEVVCKSINIAIDEKALKWSYVEAILKNWMQQKVKTVADIERIEAARRPAKKYTPASETKPPVPNYNDAKQVNKFLEKLRAEE